MNLLLAYGPGTDAAPQGFQDALATAAGILDAALTAPITVTIAIGWQDIGGPLASAFPEWGGAPTSYAAVVADLSATNTPPGFLADLPPDPTGGEPWLISTAEKKAFGLLSPTSPQIDGSATFNSAVAWSFDNSAVAGTYDLVGAAEHELTHALGRITEGGVPTGLSLVTYSDSSGQLDLNTADQRHFSLDGGKTDLANFDSTSDPGDLTTATADPFDAYFQPGEAYTWTPLDTEMMNALGFGGHAATTDITPTSLAQTGLHFIGPDTAPTTYVARASGDPGYTANIALRSGDLVQLWGMTPADLASGAVNLGSNCLYSTDPLLPKVVLAGANILNCTITQQSGCTIVQEH